ncbi:MAG: hypothetical protein JST61_10260 [Acidobacteria bacterium]|nr:hypothetical protein [Acidobacteriota bacterium]
MEGKDNNALRPKCVILSEAALAAQSKDLRFDRGANQAMVTKVEVIAVGDELGIVLPPETLEHLKVSIGDTVNFTETANRFRISRLDSDPDTHLNSKHNV